APSPPGSPPVRSTTAPERAAAAAPATPTPWPEARGGSRRRRLQAARSRRPRARRRSPARGSSAGRAVPGPPQAARIPTTSSASREQLSQRAELVAVGARVLDDAGQRLRRGPAVAVRIAPVPIVEQDDGPGAQLVAHAPADLVGGGTVRIPHAERPADHTISQPPRRRAHEGIAIAVRGAEHAWQLPGNCRDRVVSLLKLRPHTSRAAHVELDVVLRVVPDLMSQDGGAPGRRREPAHVVTDHKECGGHTLGLECVEDAVGGLGVWAVVEGEIQPPSGAGATPDRPA